MLGLVMVGVCVSTAEIIQEPLFDREMEFGVVFELLEGDRNSRSGFMLQKGFI